MSARASILLVAAAVAGCSAPVVDDVADANGAMTEGVVVVERRVGGDGATQTNVSAKFMRLSTPIDPDLAERLVGSKLEWPVSPDSPVPAAGVCKPVGTPPSADHAGRDALGTIELVDVGDVTLRAGAAVMPLAPRAFPDVGDLVSGMFYTSPDTASDLPTAAAYTLEGTGAGLVDRFTIDAEAPPALEDVRIGDALTMGETPKPPLQALLAEGVSIEEGAPIALRWSAPQSAAHDLVLVDVSAESGATVRCAFPDAGKALMPAWVLRGSTLGQLPATATVTIHRVRENSFVAPGIDAGEVRFDLSVIGRVLVTPRAAPAP